MASPLRIGFVPEHFSTFPSGTGHMITALRANEIDVGIGLTEAWIAGLGKDGVEGDGGYRLVGTYVETPLCKCSKRGQYQILTMILSFQNFITNSKY
jgi:hypothetical protein